jgi:hypothetical protein
MFGSQRPALNCGRLERWLQFFIAITTSKLLVLVMLLIAVMGIIALD